MGEVSESAAEGAFHLRDLWAVVSKRRWVVVTFFVVLLAVVLLGTLSQTPIHRAMTTIAILPDKPKVLNIQEVQEVGVANYYMWQDYYNTQNRIIRSVTIARRVVDRLGLTQETRDGRIIPMAPQTLLANLEVLPVKESQLVTIAYHDPDPEQAARVANTVAEVYIEENLNQRVEITQQAVEWLGRRLTELKNQVVESERAMYEFKSAHKIVGLDDRHNLALQKLTDLNTAFSRVHTERVELEARWKKLSAMLKAGGDREAVMAVLTNQLVQNLKQNLVELERERSQLARRYRLAHPKMVRLEEQIRFVSQRIDGEIDRILESVRQEYQLKHAEEVSLARELEAAKRQALDLNQKLINHMALQQEAEKNQQLYDVLLGRLKETDLSASLRSNNIRVVDAAERPTVAVKPNLRINLGLALLVGLIGGVGLAFFFEFLDNTVKTGEDIERHLGFTQLGVLPALEDDPPADERDRWVDLQPLSTFAESMRSIRTNLAFLGATRPLQTLLVTSATPLEGKSTTCANLGIALAQAGQRVLLVDTDLRRSRLHRAFQLSNERGFSTLLLGSDDLAGAVQATGIENLDLLPSGPIPPNPSELLEGERFEKILAALAGRYDRIIFDSPPVIPVTDAIVLSRRIQGTIFVIKAGQVPRELAAQAARRLSEVDAHVLGAVLNGVEPGHGAYTYGYRYEYGPRPDEA